jgi:hypothetical protein
MNSTKIAITIEVECYSETFTLIATRSAFPDARIETLGDALREVMFRDPANLERFGFSNPAISTERKQEFVTSRGTTPRP